VISMYNKVINMCTKYVSSNLTWLICIMVKLSILHMLSKIKVKVQ